MSNKKLVNLKRKEERIEYRKLYIIITEGETEENYFNMLKTIKDTNVEVYCTRGKHSNIKHLLSSADKKLKDNDYKKNVVCYVVLDCDVLSKKDFDDLRTWKKPIVKNPSDLKRECGLTNPCIEYWILLHFELPVRIRTKTETKNRLKKKIPSYSTPFKNCAVVKDLIRWACVNAQSRCLVYEPNFIDNPGTNIHLLINEILPN